MDKKRVLVLISIVMIIGAFFRFYKLDSIPPGLYPDEAMNGNNAVQALEENNFKLFYPENYGREGFFINLATLSFSIFGIGIWQLKIISALIGTLTLLGIFLLAKTLFNIEYPAQAPALNPVESKEIEKKFNFTNNIALLSAFFTAISFWHINFSRISFRAIMVPFCLVFSFYFLISSLKKEKKSSQLIFSIVGGLFFGIGFHTYLAFRLAPLILISFFLAALFFEPWPKRKIIVSTIWFAISTFIFALPIGLYFLQNPADFFGRTGSVSVFNAENPFFQLAKGTAQTLGQFNWHGDENWRHNYSGSPQLSWPVGIFFLAGIGFLIKDIFSFQKNEQTKRHTAFVGVFLLAWFFIMLLPSILSAEGLPHALRTIGTIPICFIAAAFGFMKVSKIKSLYGEFGAKTLFIASFVFFIILTASQFNDYFLRWAKNHDVINAFAGPYVDIGNYMNNLPENINKYIIVNSNGVEVNGIPMPAQTIIFVENAANPKNKIRYILPNQLDKIENKKPTLVIPMEYDEILLKKLINKFPDSSLIQQGKMNIFEL